MKAYLAGPMRGLGDFNFPAFFDAAEVLRDQGWNIVSPAEHDIAVYPDMAQWEGYATGDDAMCPEFNFHEALTWDLQQVLDADAIILLPGWETSSGTTIELATARAVGKRVFYYRPGAREHAPHVAPERPVLLVGLIGYAQVGKDTVGAMLAERGWDRLAFADALREILYALNPMVDCLTPGVWEHERVVWSTRHLIDAKGWEYAKANGPESSDFTVRKYLQRLGTEAGRVVLGKDVWVNAAMQKVKQGGSYVITDVRFPDEAKAIKARGGSLVRVTRPGYGPFNDHESELALADWPTDAVIENDGELDGLLAKVRALVL